MRKRNVIVLYNGHYEIIGTTRRKPKGQLYFTSKEVFNGIVVKKTRLYNVIAINKKNILLKEVNYNEII